jgi:hypothetical protein
MPLVQSEGIRYVQHENPGKEKKRFLQDDQQAPAKASRYSTA